MTELIGKIITKIRVLGEYQESIIFDFRLDNTDGQAIYDTFGDCCSETYFSEIVGFENIKGKVITSVESVALIEGDYNHRKSRQYYDEVYGIKLRTADDDFCLIVYRNSSNGYYGGGCELRCILYETQYIPEIRCEEVTSNRWDAPML